MTCFLLAAYFRPFQRRRFPVRSRSKTKKEKPIFADLFRPVGGGGFVRTPRTHYSYAPGGAALCFFRLIRLSVLLSLSELKEKSLIICKFIFKSSCQFPLPAVVCFAAQTARLAPTIVQDPGLPIRRRSRRSWSQE